MNDSLASVIVAKNANGTWDAIHVPSGRKTEGTTSAEAHKSMLDLLGLNHAGQSNEITTSSQFEGLSKAIALFIEGPITETLSFHAGWARLISYASGVATIQLGGGCKGCPSSQLTLFNGVKSQLQSRFGEDVITDVVPSLDS